MMHIVIDYYPRQRAFLIHMLGPRPELHWPHDRLEAQLEWSDTRELVTRMRKHLKRRGFVEKDSTP